MEIRESEVPNIISALKSSKTKDAYGLDTEKTVRSILLVIFKVAEKWVTNLLI